MPVKRANYTNDASACTTTTTGTFNVAAVGATQVVPPIVVPALELGSTLQHRGWQYAEWRLWLADLARGR